LEEAHNKSMDYVQVVMIKPIPNKIVLIAGTGIINFNTYGLKRSLDKVYHTMLLEKYFKYDYELQVAFGYKHKSEQLPKNKSPKKSRFKDGSHYCTTLKERFLKDSLGNKIKWGINSNRLKCNFFNFTSRSR